MSGRLLRKVLKEKEDLINSNPNPQHEEEEDEPESDPPSAAPSKKPFDLLDDDGDNHNEDDQDEQEIIRDNIGEVTQQEYPVVRKTSDATTVANCS